MAFASESRIARMNRVKNVYWREYREEQGGNNRWDPPVSPVENYRTESKALRNYNTKIYYDSKHGKFVESSSFETI